MPTRPTSPKASGASESYHVVSQGRRPDFQPGLPVFNEIFELLIRVGGVGEAGVLTHGPGPPPIHLAVDTAREWRFTRRTFIDAAAADHVFQRVQRLHLDAGLVDHRLEVGA